MTEFGLKSCRPFKKPLFTSATRGKRLVWAKVHVKWTAVQWDSVMFSDEPKFNFQ
jgi:hypothetical protein